MATIMNDKESLPVPLQNLRQPRPMGDLTTPEGQAAFTTMVTTGPDGMQRLIQVPQSGGGATPAKPRNWWLIGSLVVLGIGAAGLAGWWYKKKYMDKGKPRALPAPRQPNRRSPGGSSGVPAFMRGSRKANKKRVSRRKAAPKAPKKGSNEAKGRVSSDNYRLDESMNVQTLIFPKADFTQAQAVSWAKAHDYKTDKVDETKSSYRVRQKQPGRMGPKTFRTIAFGDSGIKAVVAKKKEYRNAA